MATAGIIWLSWASLRNVHSHGFYRFFAFELILLLVILNLDVWFKDPLSWNQLVSWVLLIISLFLALHSLIFLRKIGQSTSNRADPALVSFEKTAKLVQIGAYRYIRHPMYSSLLLLGWGAFFKSISLLGIILAVLSTVFLVITARKEETENLAYFGEEYIEYMKQSKMFIPYIF